MQFLSIAAAFLTLPALSVLAATPASTTPIPSATVGACADNCLTSGAQDAGCGSFKQSSFGCLCKTDSKFSNSTTTCIQQTCQGADLAETEFIIQQVCVQASSSIAQSSTGTTRPAGGSAITTDATGTAGGTSNTGSESESISLLPTSSSFSFTGSGFPTPVPISGSGSGSTSGSGSSTQTGAASNSSGAALGRASLGVHSAIWVSMLMTVTAIAGGACYVLF